MKSSNDTKGILTMRHTIYDMPFFKKIMPGLAVSTMGLLGWRIEGQLPDLPKFVVIGAPHTSNWDFPVALMTFFAFKVKAFWMGKDALFRGPMKPFFLWLGGIPIDRSKSNNVVTRSIREFDENEQLVMLIPPSGTRKKTRAWKTGFYYIALGAKVPIVLGYADFRRKTCGLGPLFYPTGDFESDMKKIQSFYANITAKYPEKQLQAKAA